VPYGLNDVEKDQMRDFFTSEAEKEANSSFFGKFNAWLNGKGRKSVNEAAEGVLNDHSKVIFLMAPDNKFLNFYSLDLAERELAEQIIEDASYDIGSSHIGTSKRPETSDTRFMNESVKVPAVNPLAIR